MTTELGSTGRTDVAGQGGRRDRTAGRLLAALTAGVGLLAAGCGTGPSQVDAAAIVGSTAIPLGQVQQNFADVLARNPSAKDALRQQHKMPDLTRQLVTLGIQHELVNQVSREENLTASEADVDRLVAGQGGAAAAAKNSVFDENGVREHAKDQLKLIELAKRYLPKLSVTIDVTFADDRAGALDRAKKMSQGEQQAQQVVAADKAAGQSAQSALTLKALDSPENATSPLFGTPVGTVVAYQAGQQSQGGQWVVALIRNRDTNGTGDAKSASQSVDSVSTQVLQAVGQRLLVPTADRLGVRINPRYGVWDPVAIGAAASPDVAIGVEVPPHSPAQ